MSTTIDKLALIKQAANDPLFMADLEETMAAFARAAPSLAEWENFVDWLEDLEDIADIQANAARLNAGPDKSGALLWQDVASQWENTQQIEAEFASSDANGRASEDALLLNPDLLIRQKDNLR